MQRQTLFNNKKFRIILFAVATLVALTIIISLINLIRHSGKIKVTIDFQPTEAQVYLSHSDQNINQSTVYLSPGEYQLSAFLDGYFYSETTINVNEYTPTFLGQLIPIDATDSEISDLLEQLSLANSAAYSDINSLLTDKFPLLNYLPYSSLDDTFYITAELNPDYSVLNVIINLQAKNSPLAANAAYGVLESFDPDLDLSGYNITINNFTNPFENQFRDNNSANAITFLRTGFSSLEGISVQTGKTNEEYYYTVIEQTLGSDYMPYRVVLKKNGNSWELLNTPTPILTTYNTPNVPQEILNKANHYNQRSKDA